MQLHSLVLAAVAGMVGLVAGRATRPHPTVASETPAPRCIAAPAPAVRAPTLLSPEPEPEPEPDSEPESGEDIAEALAAGERHVAEQRLEHNAILGRVTDARSGEALPGVTVIATSSSLEGQQVAITDDTGAYALTGLPAGFYTLVFYYSDVTIQRLDVRVSSLEATRLADSIDPAPPPPINIPVPGRTFEEALLLSSDNTNENTFVIELEQ